MDLYEFQGRKILNDFSIVTPNGITVSSPEEAVKAAKILFSKTKKKSLVIKAQIHAGGRGKSGGIKIAKNLKEIYEISKNIIGKYLVTPQTSKKGKLVNKILISEDVYFTSIYKKITPNEYYLSILLNRDIDSDIILYSKYGGVNIEKLSNNYPERIFFEKINPILGLQIFQVRKIIYNLSITNKDTIKNFSNFLISLYKAYIAIDAILIEINPLIQTLNNKILPVDIKITLDNNSLYRQNEYIKEIHKNYYKYDINSLELQAFKLGLNFLKLNGNVGCMVNGAGLAMATMDMIQSSGGSPANFLDIGGDADVNKVEKAFSIILQDKSVRTILVNIFGGIVRCDIVAEGIIKSYYKNKQKNSFSIPLIIRLLGTNDNKAKTILKNTYLPIFYVNTLKEAYNKIKKLIK